jgi:hypothetical protein
LTDGHCDGKHDPMENLSKPLWRRWFGVAALAMTSGAAGWALGQGGHDGPAPAPPDIADARAAAPSRVPEARRHGAAIQVFADGSVSVHVDHVAAEWLLLELGRSSAVPPGAAGPANDGRAVVSDSSYEPDCVGVDVDVLRRTLDEGSESERHTALTRLLEAGIDLPVELLQRTYANDPSEAVRLLAFTTYVDSVSDDRAEVRLALESGVYNDSAALQAEAQRRLTELEQYERVLAATPPQGLP